jgi:hypothetical protein
MKPSVTTKITGYHVTSKNNWAKIQAYGLKGSKWVNDLTSADSDPFNLKTDGAVWCYANLDDARMNLDPDEVILKVEGEGVHIEHYAHGHCVVGIANKCRATLVRKNAKS